ncbi:MAG: hypothetical protein NC092_08200 [Butyrivibrio sp.]|nr:hypothetical protein [Muribaculum sp.]MCM1552657.1 hypothetical protein [Butyrivibrio sp.]
MKRGITTLIVTMAMFCMMSMSALAAGAGLKEQIHLSANQVWTGSYSISRTGDYSYVYARCNSVYPPSGTDNFTKIQARLVNSSGTLIMTATYVVLNESEGYKKLYIADGYLNENPVYIQFRGNTKDAAEAIVSYYSN